jgi:hypothetical protein
MSSSEKVRRLLARRNLLLKLLHAGGGVCAECDTDRHNREEGQGEKVEEYSCDVESHRGSSPPSRSPRDYCLILSFVSKWSNTSDATPSHTYSAVRVRIPARYTQFDAVVLKSVHAFCWCSQPNGDVAHVSWRGARWVVSVMESHISVALWDEVS